MNGKLSRTEENRSKCDMIPLERKYGSLKRFEENKLCRGCVTLNMTVYLQDVWQKWGRVGSCILNFDIDKKMQKTRKHDYYINTLKRSKDLWLCVLLWKSFTIRKHLILNTKNIEKKSGRKNKNHFENCE